MKLIPCMGGCQSRDRCPNYRAGHGAGEQETPSERLCGPVEMPWKEFSYPESVNRVLEEVQG